MVKNSRNNSKVFILKTSPRTVIKDYSELLKMANMKKMKDNKNVIKLNLSWSLYYPACSTEPWQLDGLLNAMKTEKFNFKKIKAVENQTVVTKPWKGAYLNKWLPVLDKYNLEFTPLPNVKWVPFKPKGDVPFLDKIFPEGLEIPELYKGANVIHLPTMKDHGHTTMTGSMKNAFGGLLPKRRHHSHKHIHEVLVDLLTIQKEIHPNIFTVTDGTIAGNGAGPRIHMPYEANYILASYDPVAIDTVHAHICGHDPNKIDFIKLAHEKGLGCGDFKQIDIIGEDVSKVNLHFQTKESIVIATDKLLRKKSKLVEQVYFHTPLVYTAIWASGIYHDKLWYPNVGKKIIADFKKTGWGKLFDSYKYGKNLSYKDKDIKNWDPY